MDENKDDFTMINQQILISDVASMMRRKVDPNERPYDAAVIRYNNSLVDEWHDKVLKKIATGNRGTVRAGAVYSDWNYFYTGKTISPFIENLKNGYISRPSEKTVDYWKTLFEKSTIEELVKLGAPAVGYGWSLIRDETFTRKSVDRWEKVYKHTNDPLEWRKLANEYPSLWNMEHESPFWVKEKLEEITQKVMTVLKINVVPQ